MNSCLYECSVMHHRFAPKVHHFQHSIFMFYLDLDELNLLSKKIMPFSYNRWNLYSFRDSDHEPAGENSLKNRIMAFLRTNGIETGPFGRVMLLTLPRMLGYVFNPISIYFCFDKENKPIASVAEVGNTFLEKKLYLLGRDELSANGVFNKITTKHFYVSPFSALDLNFDFKLKIPGEVLDIKVDDREGDEKILVSTLTGQRTALNNRRLLWFTIKYPLVTLKVIFLIHWHALLLWLKGVPFHRKVADAQSQQDVLRPHSTLASKAK
jgi:uncharacterized protein